MHQFGVKKLRMSQFAPQKPKPFLKAQNEVRQKPPLHPDNTAVEASLKRYHIALQEEYMTALDLKNTPHYIARSTESRTIKEFQVK